MITWRYADTGALIQSGTDSNNQALPIVKLAQSDLLRLRMPVPEDAVRYVKVGDTLQVRVDALDRSFTGKVVRFTRDVNFETRTMETEVDVENKDLSIDPGMYANTQLQLNHADNVLTIPVEALVLKGNKDFVYVLDSQNHVHERDGRGRPARIAIGGDQEWPGRRRASDRRRPGQVPGRRTSDSGG